MSKQKKKLKSKKTTRAIISIALLLIILTIGYIWYQTRSAVDDKNTKTTPEYEKSQLYKEGQGGDPDLVVEYHDQSYSAWVKGDKQKAKQLAEQGQSEARKLTKAQHATIVGQADIMQNLDAIVKGREPYAL